jgi:hypothetical protein
MELLVHHHVPRTGGTTLQTVLTEQYGQEGVLVIPGTQPLSGVRRVLTSPTRADVRALSTSHPYGIARLIGAQRTMTMLRSPVDRVLSYVDYLRREPGGENTRWQELHLLACGSSLEEYLASGEDNEVDNWQVRLLSGAGTLPAFGSDHTALLDQARANLDEIDAVGLTERIGTSIEFFARQFGWRTFTPVRRNASGEVEIAARSRLPRSTVDRIRDLNRADEQLYRAAVQRFECQTCRLEPRE